MTRARLAIATNAPTGSVDLDDLLAGNRVTTVVYETGREVTCSYNPARISSADLIALDTVPGLPVAQQLPILATFVSSVITSWDLARKGVPIPITEEECLKLPVGVLLPLVGVVREEQTPDPPPAPTS